MFKSFLKISLRNFIKNKSNTVINVIGLSLGITCSLIIFLIISFETSFNSFNKDSKNIYRFVTERTEYGKKTSNAGVPYPRPVLFKTEFANAYDEATFVDANIYDPLVTVKHSSGKIDKYNEDMQLVFVDPAYFKIFTYDWLRGDKYHALNRPHTAVISETLAKKYFKTLDVIGKTLTINKTIDVEITGVVKDPPLNSDLPFHLFIEIPNSGRISDNMHSTSSSVQFFIKAKNKIPQSDLDAFAQRHKDDNPVLKARFFLQPINEMHLDDNYGLFADSAVSKETLWALGCIGIFLILMACINYINLNTAVAIGRAREVGIRKVLGGTRSDVVYNFLIETSMLILFSIFLSVAFTELALGGLKEILGYKLSLSMFSSINIILYLAAIFILISAAAGLYPAMYLSGFKSLEAVRTRMSTGDNNSRLRKSLVVVQFAIAHIIIIGTLIVLNQIDFFRSKDLGFNKEAILEVSMPENTNEVVNILRSELSKIPEIKNVSFSNNGAASPSLWTTNFVYKNGKQVIENNTQIKLADAEYLDTYGISLLAGRGLTVSDTAAELLVNQAFVGAMGLGANYSEALGAIVKVNGADVPVVGVVKNFNSQALHFEVSPLMITSMTGGYYQAGIKIKTNDYSSVISKIEKAWLTAYPDYVFDCTFLDETVQKFYEREERTSAILNSFSFIAILISCMGLFGLAAYSISTKTKEIGIRKVLGATLTNILTLITMDFFKLIIIGFILAIPAAYYLMNLWLDDFAYKITIGPGVFIIAILFTSVVALLTVGYMSLKAATANPVKSLKYE